MRIRRVISRRFDSNTEGTKDGTSVAGGINAVIAGNVAEPGRSGVVGRQRIVARVGRRSPSEAAGDGGQGGGSTTR